MERRGGRSVPANSPIERWLASLHCVADGVSMLNVPHAAGLMSGSAVPGESLAAACDLYAACAAAHAIQTIEALRTQGALTLIIDGSFVSQELGVADMAVQNVAAMPAGVGTLLVAADAARLREGSLHIFGNGSPGLDVEWIGPAGQTIRIEAKSRAFSRAFDSAATRDQLLDWVGRQTRIASSSLRSRSRADGADALHVVQLTSFLPVELARAMPSYHAVDRIRSELARLDREDLPHAVVAHWYGVDVEACDGGLVSVADSLSHTIDVPLAAAPTRRAIASFYEMVELPPIYRHRLVSRETLNAHAQRLLAEPE